MILTGMGSNIIWGNMPFHKSNNTMIAKVGDSESKRDSCFENRLVYSKKYVTIQQRLVYGEHDAHDIHRFHAFE